MKLVIVSFAPLIFKDKELYSYAPYVNEMRIWARHSDEIAFCCPRWKSDNKLLIGKIPFQIHKFFETKDFNFQGIANSLKALINIPYNFFIVLQAMAWADHIHLRCPGNLGLIGSIAQIFFPGKRKTAKYAGNWDWNSPQPFTYRMQQRILRNTFLSRKMTVLVYGNWPDKTENIKPFFTASYSSKEAIETKPRNLDPEKTTRLIFVGALSIGKNPLLSLKVAEKLNEKGIKARIHFYGEGKERPELEKYITDNNLSEVAFIHGNQDKEILKAAFIESHFLVFISKSEGWPKAVAEAMFWGCVPITTRVSCVPEMLNEGERGDLIEDNLESCITVINNYLNNKKSYSETSERAMQWSRQFTLERFEEEITKLLANK